MLRYEKTIIPFLPISMGKEHVQLTAIITRVASIASARKLILFSHSVSVEFYELGVFEHFFLFCWGMEFQVWQCLATL